MSLPNRITAGSISVGKIIKNIEMIPHNHKFILKLINNKVFTFDAETFSKLRSEHRIMGTLVGMIPGFANNNDMNGLPAFYNIYEVYLLLQKKLIMLIDDSHLKNVPSAHQQKSYTEFISGHIQPQEKVKLEKSVKSLSVPLSNDNEHNPELVGIERHDPFIQIPTAHYTFINEITSISSEYFHNKIDIRKYRIFEDLWHKHKYITSGESFGGDLLIYSGDPMNYHASHIVHIIENPLVSPLQLVSYGRMAVNVNKIGLLASINEQNEIVYQTVKWKQFEHDLNISVRSEESP